MSLLLSSDQHLFAENVRRFVRKTTPLSHVREVVEEGRSYDTTIWKRLSGELGLAGLVVPESLGGAGATYTELSVALNELGAALVPSPLLACTLVTAALEGTSDQAGQDLLARIASGEEASTVALSEPRPERTWIPVRPAVTVRRDGAEARLTGTKTAVLNAGDSRAMVVLASDGDRRVLCLVDRQSDGVRITDEPSVDLTQSRSRVEFTDCEAVVLDLSADEALVRVQVVANLALVSQHCGAMRACIDFTSEYARTRIAFGQPIGTYQGVKHPLADAYCTWELSQVLLREATRVADSEGLAAALAPSAAARAYCSPSYLEASVVAIHLHGGIGFTWEHDAHFYYKNALVGVSMCGDTSHQLAIVDDHMEGRD